MTIGTSPRTTDYVISNKLFSDSITSKYELRYDVVCQIGNRTEAHTTTRARNFVRTVKAPASVSCVVCIGTQKRKNGLLHMTQIVRIVVEPSNALRATVQD